jgi:uncharacterized membrane protein (UPF0127 family)
MQTSRLAPRLRCLSLTTALGREVRVASGFRVRLLGLAHLSRDEAGPGLLIPRCSSVHTFGMRFPLDLYFLDEAGEAVAVHRDVPRRRMVVCCRAVAVLETPR